MAANMMPGAPVAEAVFNQLSTRIEKLRARGYNPGLGTILVGGDSASAGYIRMKQEKAVELGFNSPHIHLGDDATQDDLVSAIRSFNDDPGVDAMLVQHPTPPQIDYETALLEMDPEKDVDGLHPVNMGRLAMSMPGPVPCTPAGIEAILATTRSRSRGTRSASWDAARPWGVRWRCCCRRSGRPPTLPSPSSTPACRTGSATRAEPK